MRCIRDEDKSRTNRAKHGVSFEIAMEVFDDPHALSVQDRVVGNEERWQTIGLVEAMVILHVAHTISDDDAVDRSEETIRIISARRATPGERRNYERHREGKAG